MNRRNAKVEGGRRLKGYLKKYNQEKPLISVITVVFNGEDHLEGTIQSVINQSYKNIEYIIIDGASTDKTLEIIKKYEDYTDYWLSEPDEGISDAFNKGISVSTGEIIGIINADDWYEIDTVNLAVETFQKTGSEIVCGKARCFVNSNSSFIIDSNPSNLIYEMTVCHPTVFIKRYCYDKFGYFNKKYKYAMDYDLLLRFKNCNCIFSNTNIVMTNMRREGASDKNWKEVCKEDRNIKIINDKQYLKAFYYYYFQLVRSYISRFLEKIGLRFLLVVVRKYFSLQKKEYK